MVKDNLITGFFANTKRGTKVHLIKEGRNLLCGSKVASDMELCWCSMSVALVYLECERCKKAYMNLIKE